MTQSKRVGDLEIKQDLEFQQLSWKLQRIGWCIMALLLVVAMAGLLGPGPLSQTIAGEKDSALWVEYNRFERYQAPVMLQIHLGAGIAQEDRVRLWINRDYTKNIELDHIDPEPESVEVNAERSIYTFNIADPQQPAMVIFHLEPNTQGQLPVRVGLDNGPELNFSQFFYP